MHYFVVKFIVWYLLFSGRDATSKRFMEEYRRLFAWKKEKGYKITIPFYSNRIKSEPLINRIYISIFLILDKLHLVSVFSKLYCKG